MQPNETVEQTWEELEGIYNALANSVLTISTKVAESLEIIKASGIEDSPDLVSTVRTVTTDINDFVSTLIEVHSKHEDKKGTINNGDELTLCIELFNEYVSLNERFVSITNLPMLTITEYLATASELIAKEATNEQS